MTSRRRRSVSVVLLALAVAATGVALFVATAGPATAKEFATLHPLEGTVGTRKAQDDGVTADPSLAIDEAGA